MKTSFDQNLALQTGFSDPETGVIKNVVSAFLRKYPWFKGCAFEDLVQECCIHWLARRHQYDPKRGASRTTFMADILRRRLLDILDEQMRDKRRVNQAADSLDAPKDPTDPDITYQDGLTKDKVGPAGDANQDSLFIRHAVRKSLEHLPPFQKDICRLFAEGRNITEIAMALQKSRTTIHQEINRIREIFHQDRLHDFL